MRQRLDILLLCLMLALQAGAQAVWNHHEDGVDASVSHAAMSRTATRFFAMAVQETELGHHDAAYDLLHHVLAVDPQNSAAMFRLSAYEMYLRRDSLAERLLRRSVQLDPGNPDYIEALAAWCERHDSVAEATRHYEHLLSIQRARTEVASHLYKLYMKQERYADAVTVLDHIETLEGLGREVALSKYNVYLEAMGDTAAAFAQLYRLVREFPGDVEHRITLASHYISDRNMPDSARVLLDAVAQEEPDNANLAVARLDYAERYDTAHYALLHDSLLYAAGTHDELRHKLIFDQLRRGVADSAGRAAVDVMFTRLAAVVPDEMSVWSAKLIYQQVVKVPTDSLVVTLETLRRLQPDNRSALTQLLQCYAMQGDFERMAAVCDDGIVYYPQECLFYYYSGLAYYNKEDKATALQRFTAAVRQINDDTELEMAARMYSTQGDLLYDAGRHAEAFAAYDSCLVYNPDEAPCLNNYAYYLSLADTALARAEQMSFRTLRLDPGNRTYIDTYAWILFKQGNYGEARRYMDQVMLGIETPADADSVGVSADVPEHAGDICACQGDMEAAVKWWRLALDMGSDRRALLNRKIRKRKYIAK